MLLLSAYDGVEGFCMGLVLNEPTAARVGATPLLGGRGQTVGPAGRSATPEPIEWTTGGRRLTDAFNGARATAT